MKCVENTNGAKLRGIALLTVAAALLLVGVLFYCDQSQ